MGPEPSRVPGAPPERIQYLSDDYRHRYKIFRPKIRSAIRRSEAAAAQALFSTADVVEVKAADDSNPQQQASADIVKALMNHHLTKTVPWFITCMAAFQTAQAMGEVASKQYWKFEEAPTGRQVFEPVLDPASGTPTVEEGDPDPETGEPTYRPVGEWTPEMRVTCDRPEIELIPTENVFISPDSPWVRPAQSSPLWVMQELFIKMIIA